MAVWVSRCRCRCCGAAHLKRRPRQRGQVQKWGCYSCGALFVEGDLERFGSSVEKAHIVVVYQVRSPSTRITS